MNEDRRRFLLASLGLLAAPSLAMAQSKRQPTTRSATQPADEFLTDVPPAQGSVVLSRPTDRSALLTVIAPHETTVHVAYGDRFAKRTRSQKVGSDSPTPFALDGLASSAQTSYRVIDDSTGKPLFADASFHTARKAGEAFTFTIQADSHLDGGCRQDVYARCIANQIADAPDFVVDLGDTFMTGKHPSRASALKQYLAQRYFLSPLARSAPLFMVIGNHDGEEAKLRGATLPGGLSLWSHSQRTAFFPNPVPDDSRFYTGNSIDFPGAGLLQNYYAFTWGDLLLVALDPYWTSTASRGNGAGWNMSIGRAQYDWLAATLRASRAKHKAVFIHQLVGGLDDGGRGGAEAAKLFEWGGRELDGANTFARKRPGWPKPIHDLLVEAGVKIVFHGHDHFYAKQELDGIVYQLVPQPAHRNARSDHAAEYGYKAGEFIPNSGHLRVRVDPKQLQVEYVRAAAPDMERRGVRDGAIAASYVV